MTLREALCAEATARSALAFTTLQVAAAVERLTLAERAQADASWKVWQAQRAREALQAGAQAGAIDGS
jgi:hypothetical protein